MNIIIIKKILSFIEKKEVFVIVTILKSSGSTPRIKGTNMIVSCSGNIFNTIGGGILEFKIIKAALEVINKKQSDIVNIKLSSEKAGGIGMICGGQLSVMMDLVQPKDSSKNFFKNCLDILNHEKYDCNFLIIYHKNKNMIQRISRYLMHGKKILLKDKTNQSKDEITLLKQFFPKAYDFKVVNINNTMLVYSPTYVSPKLYIIGAGHVAQPTSIIAKIVGFNVFVLDDRKTFANVERFPNVKNIKIVNFNNVFKDIKIGAEAFIVIITRGHLYDAVVLEQAMSTNAYYIGMIGSEKKRDIIFKNLREKGIKKEKLQKIYSPIGIDINSETPEEIALSIVSEMVLVRSRRSLQYR